MGLTNFKNGISVYGIPVLPQLGGNMVSGNAYWVDSNASNAASGNAGSTNDPMATVDQAINKTTANNGDIILLKENHTEDITAAAGLACDVAGVRIIGLGTGRQKPVLNFTTAVGADMDIDAADVYIENIDFSGGIDALTGPIDVNAADFTMVNCEYRDSTGQATDAIVADANADRMKIYGYRHRGASGAGGASAIQINGADDCEIDYCKIDGNFDTAAIENVTADWVDIEIANSWIRNRARAACIKGFSTSASGWLVGPMKLMSDNVAVLENTGGMQVMHPVDGVTETGQYSSLVNIGAKAGSVLGKGH